MTLVLFIFGLIFGSFVNALVWRVHVKRKWWGNERSMCPHCKHTLATKDLVPVLSWLMLRGRCRYCNKLISVQYPLVEMLTGVFFVGSYLFWPYTFTGFALAAFICWLIAIIMLVALSVYDLKWMLLPDKMVITLTVITITLAAFLGISEGVWHFVWSIVGGIALFGVLWLLFQVSKGKWIGGGDVKLVFALGMLAGTPVLAVLVLFLASVIGTLVMVPMLLLGKSKLTSKIPFGPFLMLATVIIFMFGRAVIDWYTTKLLY